MTIETTRRGFLKFLGIGAAAAIIEEPVRKLWFVGSNAPVGSKVEPAWTIDAAAQRLYEACGKPFPLPGEYMLPSNGRTWGWYAVEEPATATLRIFNGSKQAVGRINKEDWEDDKAGALEALGFRLRRHIQEHQQVYRQEAYEKARAKAAEMSKADEIAKQAFDIARGEWQTQIQNAQRRAVESAGYSPWVTDPSLALAGNG